MTDSRPPPRSSPTARLALVVAVGLLVYASLFPNTSWVDSGVSAFAWIGAPFPRYWTRDEIVFNVLVYMPLGVLLAWSLRPRWRGVRLLLLCTLIAAALSFSMESLQTFVPARVASNVDFCANTGGAAIGAVLGLLTSRRVIDEGWHVRWSEYVFKPDMHACLVLVAGWLLVQTSVQAMLFGTGNMVGLFPHAALALESWLPGWMTPPPEWRVRAEQWCTALAIVAVSLLLLHAMRPWRARALVAPLLVGLALAAKIAAQPLILPGEPSAMPWLTPGAGRGIVMGTLAAMALAYVSPIWQRRIALSALVAQIMIVNLFPLNPYFLSTVASGYTGFLYLDSLANELAAGWPLAAIAWMLFGAGSRRVAAGLPQRDA